MSGQNATCVAPEFMDDSKAGPVVVSGNPLWFANGPDGANASRLGGVSGRNGTLSSIESWKVTQPDGTLTDDTFTTFQLTTCPAVPDDAGGNWVYAGGGER